MLIMDKRSFFYELKVYYENVKLGENVCPCQSFVFSNYCVLSMQSSCENLGGYLLSIESGQEQEAMQGKSIIVW